MTPASAQANSRSTTPSNGRFSATLLFSLLLHGMLLFGITFHFAAEKPDLPTLDVTLLDVANQQAPDKADFLAQTNNQGGGDNDKAARPSQPYSGLLPTPSNGIAPRPLQASASAPQAVTDDHRLTTRGQSPYSIDSQTAQPPPTEQPLPESTEDIQRAQEMAQLTAEVRDQSEAYAKRPKKKFISANTREYVYAAYMRGWVDRIERIGNQNYPVEARRRGLHGELELTVGLNHDGSVRSIDVIRSSGFPLLDEAAKRIVQLAAPYPPLPAETDKVDQLYITRTWEFMPDNVLRDR